MSVATSRDERAAAAARLQSLSAFDTNDQYDELKERLIAVQELHQEEQAWIQLHADEIRRRRDQARGEATS